MLMMTDEVLQGEIEAWDRDDSQAYKWSVVSYIPIQNISMTNYCVWQPKAIRIQSISHFWVDRMHDCWMPHLGIVY